MPHKSKRQTESEKEKPLVKSINPRPLLEVEVGSLTSRQFANIVYVFAQRETLSTSMFTEVGRIERNLTEQPKRLKLVVLSVGDLGFTKGATLYQTIAEAMKHQLRACPQETAFIARDHYRDQPAGEKLHIAMVPVENCFFGMDVCVLYALSDDRRYIGSSVVFQSGCGRVISKETIYLPSTQFVFVDARR